MTRYEVYGRGGSIGEQKDYKKNNKTKFVSGVGEMFLLGTADSKDKAKAIASGWKKSFSAGARKYYKVRTRIFKEE